MADQKGIVWWTKFDKQDKYLSYFVLNFLVFVRSQMLFTTVYTNTNSTFVEH